MPQLLETYIRDAATTYWHMARHGENGSRPDVSG